MKTRGVDWVNNLKALANDPALLARVWAQVKEVMAPGALDPLVKEMIYVAVSATSCEYCTLPHRRRAQEGHVGDVHGAHGGGRPRQSDQPPRERPARAGRPAFIP